MFLGTEHVRLRRDGQVNNCAEVSLRKVEVILERFGMPGEAVRPIVQDNATRLLSKDRTAPAARVTRMTR